MTFDKNQLSKMSFGDVLDYSVAIFKKNFIKISKIIIILYLPLVLLNALVSGSLVSSQFGMYADLFSGKATTFNPANQLGTKYIVLSLLSYLMSFIMLAYTFGIQSVMDAAIIKTTFDDAVYGSDSLSVKSLIKYGFKKWGDLFVNKLLISLISTGILIGVVIVGTIAIVPIIMGASFMGDNTLTTVFIIVVAVVLVLAVIVVAFYYLQRFAFGKVSIVSENQSGTSSISRSWKMTKGHFFHISSALTFGGMLFYFAPTILSASLYILVAFNKEIVGKVTIAAYTILQISTAFVYPFIWILLTVIYINLKIKNEGYDLEIKVDRLLQEQAENKTDNLELL